MAAPSVPLEVEQLGKVFRQGGGEVSALSGIDLTVRRGEFVAVMGASGSGKSTLLHLASGLTRPNRGRVLVDSVDLSTLSDNALTRFRRRRIGVVFQSLNLIPSLTAEQNVALPLRADNAPTDAYEVVPALMDRFGMAPRRGHRPDALSGGEQQRVAIARALVHNPALILADEPTGNLDSQNSENLCQTLRDLSESERRTIVVVTHEAEVAMWADRVLVLKDGRLLSEFPTADFSSASGLSLHYHALVDGDRASEKSG